MRRHVRLIIICLLIGVIANLTVAWVTLWNVRFAAAKTIVPHDGDHPALTWWRDRAPDAIGPDQLRAVQSFRARGVDIDTVFSGRRTAARDDSAGRYIRAGLPYLSVEAMHWVTITVEADGTRRRLHDVEGGLRIPAVNRGFEPGGSCVLPWWPMWPGAVINTLIFSALAWIVIVPPLMARRAFRRWRRRCQWCGYPIGTSSVCTECGRPLARHRPATEAPRHG